MIQLPWSEKSGPHLVLDITGLCNLACCACYKRKDDTVRSVSDVLQDLDVACRMRRVQTVSLAGAEPTLHPQLPEIVDAIHRRDMRVSLVTNGIALSDSLLAALKRAGLDVVMLHIDEGQNRPDLEGSVNALRRQLADRVASHGLDVGLSVTLYPDSFSGLPDLVQLILDSPSIHFAFITHQVDMTRFGAANKTSNADIVALMRDAFGLEPFACVGPYPAWLSYFVPVVQKGTSFERVSLRSGWADAALVRLPRLLSGRNMFYCPQRAGITRFQTMVNLISRGHWIRARRFRAHVRDAQLYSKRIVFDNGAGDCRSYCPNPTVRNGQLMPVCMVDMEGAA